MSPTTIGLLDHAATAAWPDPGGGLGVLVADAGADSLPLAFAGVRARLDGLVAHVELTQTFVNTLGRPAEVAYRLPLPDRLTVTQFRIEAGGRTIESIVKERPDPGRSDSSVPAGVAPGAVFAVRAGNIPAGDSVTVRLALVGPLACADNEVEFRFPLTVDPHHTPSRPILAPVATGDGVPAWLADYPNPVRLSFRLDVHSNGLGAAGFRCSQSADVRDDSGDGVHRIEFRPDGRIEGGFVLRYQLGGRDTRASFQLVPDGPGVSEGTFVLTLVPPVEKPGAGRPRDVVVLLDRSAGMAGWKLAAARAAAGRVIEALGSRDRFAVLAFDGQVAVPPRFDGAQLVPADAPHRAHAAAFLAGLADRGGVPDVAPALTAAAALLRDDDLTRDRILLLVTAAQVGHEDTLLRGWAGKAETARAVCLGVGDVVNGRFLRRLAEVGGGACELAETADRVADAIDRVVRTATAPRLTGLAFAPTGFEILPESVTPARPADVYSGAPACVRGRYKGSPEGTVAVAGKTADGRPWGVAIPARVSANAALTTAWAATYVRQLEDRYAAASSDRSVLAQRMTKAALRYRVPSRFTMLVAVERAAGGRADAGPPRRPPPAARRAGGTAPDLLLAGRRGESGSRVGRYTVGDEPIHGYTLLALFGRGQFEEVWKARDKASGKLVAIKIIDLAFSPTALKELRALNLLKNLNHPNLIPIFTARLKDKAGQEVGFEQLAKGSRQQLSELAIAVGLGEKSLVDRLAEINPDGTPYEYRQGLPVKELIRYMKGAARGVDFLNKPDHGLGDGDGPIVHCDIKPKNLMIVAGEVQIAGAGFARIINQDARQTRMPGSPAYTAPELLSSFPGAGTDQYSLAISYYELRTGWLPFPPGATLPQIILAHAQSGLDLSAPVLSDPERAVIRRATAKAPADRFESCDEFVEELSAVPDIRTALRAKKGVLARPETGPAALPSSLFELPLPSRRTPANVNIPSLAEIDLDREADALERSGGSEADLTPPAPAWADVAAEPPAQPGRPSSGTIDFDAYVLPDDSVLPAAQSDEEPATKLLDPEEADRYRKYLENRQLSPEALALIHTKPPSPAPPPPPKPAPRAVAKPVPPPVPPAPAMNPPPRAESRPVVPPPPAPRPAPSASKSVPPPPRAETNADSPPGPDAGPGPALAPDILALLRGEEPPAPPPPPKAESRAPGPAAPDPLTLPPEVAAILHGDGAAPGAGSGPELAPDILALLRGEPPPAPPPPRPGAQVTPRPTPPLVPSEPVELAPEVEAIFRGEPVAPPPPPKAESRAAAPPPPPEPPVPPPQPAVAPPVGPAQAPVGKKGFGLPVDPDDPLGRRYVTGVPDAEILKIIADSQRVPTGKTSRPPSSLPPTPSGSTPPASPPPPPPPPRPSFSREARATSPLANDEIQKLIAESQRLQAKARKKAPPPEVPPPPRRPHLRRRTRPPAPAGRPRGPRPPRSRPGETRGRSRSGSARRCGSSKSRRKTKSRRPEPRPTRNTPSRPRGGPAAGSGGWYSWGWSWSS